MHHLFDVYTSVTLLFGILSATLQHPLHPAEHHQRLHFAQPFDETFSTVTEDY